MTSETCALAEGDRSSNVAFIKGGKKRGSAAVAAKRKRKCNCDKSLTSLAAGIFLLGLAVFLHLTWDDLLEMAINKEFVLAEGSRSHDVWVKNSVPLFMDFYLFNWTNPGDIRSPSYKAAFEERGPYRFREHVEKVNVTWNSNGTVTFKKLKTWRFVAEESRGSLDDTITTLNVVALAAAHATRNWISFARKPISFALAGTQKIQVSRKVREYLYEGYSDPLIDLATKIPGLSSQVPLDRFGWFYKRNGSAEFDGVLNMDTGSGGMEGFGRLRAWNHRNTTDFYGGRCGRVEGSAGEFWPPKRTKTEDIFLFTPDLCRYIGFKYKEEVSVKGLTGYRYDSGAMLFDNGTADPANECFCGGECVPSGALNVSTCRYGTPGFVSYPHFHLADPYYRNAIVGMRPDARKHDMYIVLEPTLGIPLEVAARLQINILLRPDPDIGMYNGVPKIFFPMIWFEQKVTVPDEMVSTLKILLALPVLGKVSYVVLYAVGVVFVVIYATRKCSTNARYNLPRVYGRRPKTRDNSYGGKVPRNSFDM